MAADEARRGGLNVAEADRAARLKAGRASLAIDALRDQRGLPWLDDWARDVRHGLRALGRTPGFTGVALVTLALGIGANSAIFSIVNGEILRPLIYSKPEQLVRLTAEYPVLHRPAPDCPTRTSIPGDEPVLCPGGSIHDRQGEYRRGLWCMGRRSEPHGRRSSAARAFGRG